MNKKLLTLALLPAISLGLVPMPQQVSAAEQAQIVSGVSFRENPSVSSDRIRYLKTGETVTILDDVNSYWYKVRDQNSQVGYVSASDQYIKKITKTPTVKTGAGNIVKSVSFRSGPSVSDERIRYLQTGETVTILEKVNAYWYKVKDKNGKTGYVSTSSEYIRTNGSIPDPAPKPNQAHSVLAKKVIEAGKKYMGTPYEYGSSRSNTQTFDCSDFVRQAFKDGINLTLPADSRSQGDYVKSIGRVKTNWRDLQPGDILFFMSYQGSKASDYAGVNKATERITHDAIYLGDGKILHTYSKTSGGVRIDSIGNNSWELRFLFGGSAIK